MLNNPFDHPPATCLARKGNNLYVRDTPSTGSHPSKEGPDKGLPPPHTPPFICLLDYIQLAEAHQVLAAVAQAAAVHLPVMLSQQGCGTT